MQWLESAPGKALATQAIDSLSASVRTDFMLDHALSITGPFFRSMLRQCCPESCSFDQTRTGRFWSGSSCPRQDGQKANASRRMTVVAAASSPKSETRTRPYCSSYAVFRLGKQCELRSLWHRLLLAAT